MAFPGPSTIALKLSRACNPICLQTRGLHHRKISRNSVPRLSSLRPAFIHSRLRVLPLGCKDTIATRSFHVGRRYDKWIPIIGAEPGIDHNTETSAYPAGHESESEIKIIDYSAAQIEHHQTSSSLLLEFLKTHRKPDWAACRWIYVNGLDMPAIKSLASSKTLHRLAIEDVVHASSPTKVDWYNDHAFIVMTLQNLIRIKCGDRKPHLDNAKLSTSLSHRSHFTRNADPSRYDEVWPLAHRGFAVSAEQVSIFLTADGTVITIFEHSGEEVLTPILALLESAQTMVRSSNDPSMLVHAVIDTVVDLYLPIDRAFGAAFERLEQAVLIAPTIAQSKQLYALRSELARLRDNIIPIGSVVGMLRDHCAVAHPQAMSTEHGIPITSHYGSQLPPVQDVSSSKLISPLTRTYLADVQDHVRVLATSTNTSIRSAENLTSLIFNTISSKQNESVRQLTLVSIFFLPLTFLTGYFGMNFDPMPIVNENSDLMFWWIAGPMMGAVATFIGTRMVWARTSAWLRMRRTMKHQLQHGRSGP